MRPTVPWSWFLLAGIGLLVVTVGASAVLAPPIQEGVTDGVTDNETRQTLVGSHGGGPGYHEDGSVYLLNDTDVAWKEDSADSNFEVTRLDNGSVMVGFAEGGYTDCGPYESPCTHTGYRIVDPDPEPTIVSEYSFPVRSITNSESHAAKPLPDGGVAVSDMDQERLFVVENGSITWEWRASSFYDAPDDPTRTDWLHINDVDYIGDDRFLLSVRNANQILVIERGEGVIEVINEDRSDEDDDSCMRGGQLDDYDDDGDVRCGNPDVMDHQHNPQWLGDGAVLVADSDNDRVVELHRTEDGRWEPVWTVSEAQNIDFSWPRDADRLPNGNTLITDTRNQRLVEVDEEGSLIWSVETERIPYEADRVIENDTGIREVSRENSSVDSSAKGGMPLLSTLTVAAHSVVPALPYWFQEMQVLGTLVSTLLVVGAPIQWFRTREKEGT
ncbi:aryl-sulfate sulfotransferase [Salinibaculum salinum]|uniref:aryl-sulfate sulfotransferase n=1 Tax=Salinibaculum salinum TaxID=3131996 RepID=UPI0030ECF01F